MQKEPMTSKDYDKITELLNDLKLNQRPKILVAIEEARQLGDLKENAEYHAAKEEQANINKKIAKLEDIVTKAVIIDPTALAHNKVSFYSTVKLIDMDTDKQITYKIVSSINSDPDIGHISFNSPLAKQLLGKQEDDICIVHLPNGKKEFEIEKIYFEQ
jgi:transcription elongation factor GreA